MQSFDHNIGFLEKRQFFPQKIVENRQFFPPKIVENRRKL
jgi:hypothetical protein